MGRQVKEGKNICSFFTKDLNVKNMLFTNKKRVFYKKLANFVHLNNTHNELQEYRQYLIFANQCRIVKHQECAEPMGYAKIVQDSHLNST